MVCDAKKLKSLLFTFPIMIKEKGNHSTNQSGTTWGESNSGKFVLPLSLCTHATFGKPSKDLFLASKKVPLACSPFSCTLVPASILLWHCSWNGLSIGWTPLTVTVTTTWLGRYSCSGLSMKKTSLLTWDESPGDHADLYYIYTNPLPGWNWERTCNSEETYLLMMAWSVMPAEDGRRWEVGTG